MDLYIPVYKKMKYSNSVLIDRGLPAKGELVVKEGDKVVPFTKIGHSKLSKEVFALDPNIKIVSGKDVGGFIYEGEKIGRVGLKKVVAPYNGFLSKKENMYYFNQEKKDVWLLSGVWGIVEEVLGHIAVKIRTQTVDINFVAYSNKVLMGELIVFPNPSELLDIEYLRNFSNSVQGKIIYIGHHVRQEVYDLAVELGVGGLIAGSVDRELYTFSKSKPVAICITTGFGTYSTPKYIFEFLKTISNRHVFLDGSRGYLRVPVPLDNKFSETPSKSSLRLVKKGLSVLIFDKLHFGLTGEVDRVQNEIIYVKLNKSEEVVETKVPNIYALI